MNALMHVYPDIGLEAAKFSDATSMNLIFLAFRHSLMRILGKLWNIQRRRDFFDAFAEKHNFDPLTPENWYSINENDILSDKVPILFRTLFLTPL